MQKKKKKKKKKNINKQKAVDSQKLKVGIILYKYNDR